MFFCIRDDDTSFFTTPEDLEQAYGEISQWGPVSLAIIPFCRAGSSKGVPRSHRMRWSVHPLHENAALVDYLRERIRKGRFEAMLHGYHHDELDGIPEFIGPSDLNRKVAEGRRYLEEVLDTTIQVFVPPHNTIGRRGLRAIAKEGLHLGGTAGVRSGWSLSSVRTWSTWLHVRRWRQAGHFGIPWILNLGDHREIPGVPVTPSALLEHSQAVFNTALERTGVFCAATHYWELLTPSIDADRLLVGEHLRRLVDRAVIDNRVTWRAVGDIVSHLGAGI
jgi:hypothetical protein